MAEETSEEEEFDHRERLDLLLERLAAGVRCGNIQTLVIIAGCKDGTVLTGRAGIPADAELILGVQRSARDLDDTYCSHNLEDGWETGFAIVEPGSED